MKSSIKTVILAAGIASLLTSAAALSAEQFHILVPINPGVKLSLPGDPGVPPAEDGLSSWDLQTAELPEGEVGTEYDFDFSSLLATDPVGYSLGSLAWSVDPAAHWMSIDPETGALSGTPDEAGELSFNVTATHAEEGFRQRGYTLIVNGLEFEVTEVDAGGFHTCAITTAGALLCWGNNSYGQVGSADGGANVEHPSQVVGLTSGVTAVAAGRYHTCAIHHGDVKCWGYNATGQVGNGTSGGNVTTPATVLNLPGSVSTIRTGDNNSCAITAAGAAYCWGRAVYVGDGTGVMRTTATQVSGLDSGVTSISVGSAHACAVHNGGAKCWGAATNYRLGDGQNSTARNAPVDVAGLESGVAMISAGGNFSCAVTTGGAVQCWGAGSNGQIGNGSTTQNNPSPLTVANVELQSGVLAISTGATHACAIQSSGKARCWGNPGNGRIGNGSSLGAGVPHPAEVGGLTSSVTSISAGFGHTCAMHAGVAKCWGDGTYYQLGNGVSAGTQATAVEIEF